jgi:hypothetical protein
MSHFGVYSHLPTTENKSQDIQTDKMALRFSLLILAAIAALV